jgi:hypothetical protein
MSSVTASIGQRTNVGAKTTISVISIEINMGNTSQGVAQAASSIAKKSCFFATGKLLQASTEENLESWKHLIQVDKKEDFDRFITEVESTTHIKKIVEKKYADFLTYRRLGASNRKQSLSVSIALACSRANEKKIGNPIQIASKPFYHNFWNAYFDTLEKTKEIQKPSASTF